MIRKKIAVRIPGKLFLTGEYAVLYSAPAIITGVDRFAIIELQPCEEKYSTFTSFSPDINKMSFTVENQRIKLPADSFPVEKFTFFTAALETFYKFYPEVNTLDKISISADTRQFFTHGDNKFGFGSSAAVTVGLISGLYQYYFDKKLHPARLIKMAIESHRSAQKKSGSGGDIAVAALSGTILFRKNVNSHAVHYKKVSIPKGLTIIPIFTGKSASTSDYLKKIENFSVGNGALFNELMAELKNVATISADQFVSGENELFMESISQYFELLQKLGNAAGINIISKEHDEISGIVGDAGGVYKPSGAGGGDVGLAYFCDNFSFFDLKEELKNNGYEILDISLGLQKWI